MVLEKLHKKHCYAFFLKGALGLLSIVIASCALSMRLYANSVAYKKHDGQDIKKEISKLEQKSYEHDVIIADLKNQISKLRTAIEGNVVELKKIEEYQANVKDMRQDFHSMRQEFIEQKISNKKLFANLEYKLTEVNREISDKTMLDQTLNEIDEQLDNQFIKRNLSQDSDAIKKKQKQELEQATSDQTPEEKFKNAMDYLKANKIKSAIDEFQSFIDLFPTNNMVSNAHYWIGEGYFKMHNYESAAIEYLKCYQINPTGKRAPDGLLKLGISLGKLRKNKEACVALLKLTKEFPSLPRALDKKLKSSIEEFHCN